MYTNVGSGGSVSVTLSASSTGFTAGEQLVEVMSCTAHTADSAGNLIATLTGGLPQVFYPSARLQGSGLCSNTTGMDAVA